MEASTVSRSARSTELHEIGIPHGETNRESATNHALAHARGVDWQPDVRVHGSSGLAESRAAALDYEFEADTPDLLEVSEAEGGDTNPPPQPWIRRAETRVFFEKMS